MRWFDNYNLMLSSQSIYIEAWRERGLEAELFKPAIDNNLCQHKAWAKREHHISFIGGISDLHIQRFNILEKLSNEFNIKCFGPGFENIPDLSPLKSIWNPPVWGNDLFYTYSNTKFSLNMHGDDSPTEAANLRLLEATGCGSLLFTEKRDNLNTYFKDDEVISYENTNDLIEKLRYYQSHDHEASKIALQGRAKTLEEHTYENRVLEFESKILKLLN